MLLILIAGKKKKDFPGVYRQPDQARDGADLAHVQTPLGSDGSKAS